MTTGATTPRSTRSHDHARSRPLFQRQSAEDIGGKAATRAAKERAAAPVETETVLKLMHNPKTMKAAMAIQQAGARRPGSDIPQDPKDRAGLRTRRVSPLQGESVPSPRLSKGVQTDPKAGTLKRLCAEFFWQL